MTTRVFTVYNNELCCSSRGAAV